MQSSVVVAPYRDDLADAVFTGGHHGRYGRVLGAEARAGASVDADTLVLSALVGDQRGGDITEEAVTDTVGPQPFGSCGNELVVGHRHHRTVTLHPLPCFRAVPASEDPREGRACRTTNHGGSDARDGLDILGGVEIDAPLVRRLVSEQFPHWSHLSVSPVPRQGNDNWTFRLGDELAVRLPSHDRYVAGIRKEDRFLPLLREHLSVAVPAPVATGMPTDDYPHPWSVRQWLAGDTPHRDPALDRSRCARDLGTFLRELRAVPAADGPLAGQHSFYRGCHLSVYGDQVQRALHELGDQVDAVACWAICVEAVQSVWPTPPVWVHGDIAVGNLLVDGGRLSAVIDFGTCSVGDPACDLVIAWTFFGPDDRQILQDAAGLPAQTWARARGWALWKALITLTDPTSPDYQIHRNALTQLL